MEKIKTKEQIYNEVITLLDIVEITVKDKDQFRHLRKRILTIANDILRLGGSNE